MVIIASILLILASFIAICNFGGTIAASRRRHRGESGGYSQVAAISLIFCAIAWLLARDTFGFWAFLPTVLDLGTWVIIIVPFFLLYQFTRKP